MPEREQVQIGPDQFVERISPNDLLKKAAGDNVVDILNAKHIDYLKNIEQWNMLRDWVEQDLDDEKKKEQYLVKGKFELDEDFKTRLALSEAVPEATVNLSRFISKLFKQPPTVRLPEVSPLKDRLSEFRTRATLSGEKAEALFKEAAKTALAYGVGDIVLDHKSDGSLTPYAVVIKPHNRLDWRSDGAGGYAWVKYHETITQRTNPFDEKAVPVEHFRIITAPETVAGDEKVIEFAGRIYHFMVVPQTQGKPKVFLNNEESLGNADSRRWVEVEGVEHMHALNGFTHSFLEIPVEPVYWGFQRCGIGTPYLIGQIRTDKRTFRFESDLAFDIFRNTKPTAVIKTARDLSKIAIGTSYAIKLLPDDPNEPQESIEYLEADMSQITAQMDNIQNNRELGRRHGGTDRAVTQDRPGNAMSGVAMSLQVESLSSDLHEMSDELERRDRRIMEKVAGEFSKNPREDLMEMSIQYPGNFDLRTVDQCDVDIQLADATGSRTLSIRQRQSVATKLIGSGEENSVIQTIHKEIADNIDNVIQRPFTPEDGAVPDKGEGNSKHDGDKS